MRVVIQPETNISNIPTRAKNRGGQGCPFDLLLTEPTLCSVGSCVVDRVLQEFVLVDGPGVQRRIVIKIALCCCRERIAVSGDRIVVDSIFSSNNGNIP